MTEESPKRRIARALYTAECALNCAVSGGTMRDYAPAEMIANVTNWYEFGIVDAILRGDTDEQIYDAEMARAEREVGIVRVSAEQYEHECAARPGVPVDFSPPYSAALPMRRAMDRWRRAFVEAASLELTQRAFVDASLKPRPEVSR